MQTAIDEKREELAALSTALVVRGPARSTEKDVFEVLLPVNLYPQCGDIVQLDPSSLATLHYPLEVIEEFNPKEKALNWRVTLRQTEVFANTAGGALPSTIERVSNYTPLATGNFNGILSANDNNLQAAMETLDDHSHSGAGTAGTLCANPDQRDQYCRLGAQRGFPVRAGGELRDRVRLGADRPHGGGEYRAGHLAAGGLGAGRFV